MRGFKLLLLIILMLQMASAGREDTVQAKISKELGIDIREEMVVSHDDSHGGWHGDGVQNTVLHLSDETVIDQIRENWSPLPMSEALMRLNEMGWTGTSHVIPPEVVNGCYYWKDRHSEAVDPADDSGVHSRHSYNFTLAVFDADTNTLYFVRVDT